MQTVKECLLGNLQEICLVVEWVKSFVKRNKQLSVKFASNIKRKRAEGDTVIINNFFDNIAPETGRGSSIKHLELR